MGHSIVSKMMINKELCASWDQPTKTIVLHQVEPSKLQTLALEFANKIGDFVELNEMILDSRIGESGGDGSLQNQNNSRGNYRNDHYRKNNDLSRKFGNRRSMF